jgi:hypothetical protein
LLTLSGSNHSEALPHSAHAMFNCLAVAGILYGCARAGLGFFGVFLGADFLDGFLAGICITPFVNVADRAARASVEGPRATVHTIES